jgi:hypothetical protein
MIQLHHPITKNRCFVKERGISSGRAMEILILLFPEVMSVNGDNTDSAGAQNATRWHLFITNSVYWIM